MFLEVKYIDRQIDEETDIQAEQRTTNTTSIFCVHFPFCARNA
jgi:hypothetical protein